MPLNGTADSFSSSPTKFEPFLLFVLNKKSCCAHTVAVNRGGKLTGNWKLVRCGENVRQGENLNEYIKRRKK